MPRIPRTPGKPVKKLPTRGSVGRRKKGEMMPTRGNVGRRKKGEMMPIENMMERRGMMKEPPLPILGTKELAKKPVRQKSRVLGTKELVKRPMKQKPVKKKG